MFFSSEYFHYKTFIHENYLENKNDKSQQNLSRPGIIDARVRYRTAAWRLGNTGTDNNLKTSLSRTDEREPKNGAYNGRLWGGIENNKEFHGTYFASNIIVLDQRRWLIRESCQAWKM